MVASSHWKERVAEVGVAVPAAAAVARPASDNVGAAAASAPE